MIKKIKAEQLQVGMYIHDFNCGWLSHPFYKSQMSIKDNNLIDKIVKTGIRELYIDTAKGYDLASAPTLAEADRKLNSEFNKRFVRKIRLPQEPTKTAKKATYRQEIRKAIGVKNQARKYMSKVLANATTGDKLDLDGINPLVDDMVESITRNENAIISLLRVKKVDEYTFLHSMSVGALLIAFAKYIELSDEKIKNIGIGGMLHDIGKMQIPVKILNKPSRLSKAEYHLIKDHVIQSCKILAKNSELDPIVMQIAGEHHERFDGTGYPNGLKGSEISLGGQMAAIIDVYDALSSDRIYHKGISPSETVRKLYEWSQYHFDLDLVQKFIAFIGIYPVGTVVKLENEKLAVVIEANRITPRVRVVYDLVRNRYTRSQDIDLSTGLGQNIRIVSYEDPAHWGIDVAAVMEVN